MTSVATLNESMAVALDAALEALRRGTPFDRAALLAQHPALDGPLKLLEQLIGEATVGAPPAEPTGPLSPPERIGPYQIERLLGAGSFGAVWLAFDPDVRRRVAIKVLHPGRLEQAAVVARFQREAQVIGRLRHAGLVQLFDYSRDGPPYFLVTEYVEGIDPRRWCKERGCSPAQIATLAALIAEAMDYAHRQGVCHRDLKPGNLLIDAQGMPHILDFGLARVDISEAATLSAPTAEGQILGTLSYMAPEQIAGRSHEADARSDVYSLGVILYELLTGRLPFQGPAHLLPSRVLEGEALPPCRLNPSVPADLSAICMKAMEKQPGARYPGAAALAADLRAFATGGPVTARRHGWMGAAWLQLQRRSLEMLQPGWPLLLLLLGVVIFTGCSLCNRWEMMLPPAEALWAILATKAVQISIMILLAVWMRPAAEEAVTARALSAAERQIWSFIPGYYGGFLMVFLLNQIQLVPVSPAPMLSILSGMGFASLGSTIWGWFYLWAVFFFVLSVVIALGAPWGLTILGAGWFVCLAANGLHMRWSR